MATINRKNVDLDILDYYDTKIKGYVDDKVGTGGLTIDDALSDTSKNPVQNKVISKEIKGGKAVSGADSYTFDDSVDYPVIALNLYGKSVQNGEPTPDAPVDIVSVGDSGSIAIISTDQNDQSLIAEITSALPFCGIPVESGGNYTDSTGQQWFCDELIYNADGTGKIVKKCNKVKLASANITKFSVDDNYGNIFYTNVLGAPVDSESALKPISNMFIGINYGVMNTLENRKKFRCFLGKTGTLVLQNSVDGNDKFTSLDNMKNFVDSNDVYVIYPLAEPQEIELTTAEVDAFRRLQTFNSTTSISNDAGAEISVKYCTNKAFSEYVLPVMDSKADSSHVHDVATTNTNGFMSADDKIKLDNISANATKVEMSTTNGNIKINGTETTVYTHPSGTNPHGTTKSDVGLGNVPNVATNNQTPTFTEASSLTKLISGEKLSVAFGKISKAITDLITHIGDSVKHITSTERTNWNSAKTHADSAHAPSNAQANVIETIKVNGTTIAPTSKVVDITLDSIGGATKSHTHDDRYYTESEINTKLNAKAECVRLSGGIDLNTVTTPGFYNYSDSSTTIINSPSINGSTPTYFGLEVIHTSAGGYYVQIMYVNRKSYRRSCAKNSSGVLEWSDWTEDAFTDTTYGVATSSALGLVKSGTDITVDSSGNVSVNDDSHNHVISNVDGLQSALNGKALSSHTHNAMTGATADAVGTSGFVPAPIAGDQDKFLKADGTWSSPPSIGSSAACIVNGTGSSFTYEGNYRMFFYNIKSVNIGFTPLEFVYESKNGWLYLPESDNKVTIKLAYYTYQSGASTITTVDYYLEIKSGTIRIVNSNADYGVSELSGVALEVYGA